MRRRAAIIAALVLLAGTFGLIARLPSTTAAYTTTASNDANSFAAASAFCKTLAGTVAAVTGFESGVKSAWVWGGNGTSDQIADATVARTGNFSQKFTKNSSSTSYTYVSIGAQTVAVARFSIRFAALPSASVTDLFSTNGGSQIGLIGFDQPTGKLKAKIGAVASQLSSSALVAGLWYRVDVLWNTSTNPRTMDWRINGVAQPQVSYAQGAGTISQLYLGSTTTADVFTAWYDDVMFTYGSAADYPLPDGRVQSLLPDGVTAVADPAGSKIKDDGNTNVAVATPGISAKLADDPMASATSFVKHIGTNVASYAELSFADTARTSCVNAVGGVVGYHSSTATGGIGAAYVYDGATQRTLQASGAITNTAIAYKWAAFAPGAGTWDATKLNGLVARVGYSTNATATNYPAWDALRLEYDTDPIAASVYEDAVLADSPAGYWRLGEASGTAAAVRSGTPAGTYSGGPALGTSSLVGDTDTSPYFDGTDDVVSFGDVYDFANKATFTIECWVRPGRAAANNYPQMVNKLGGWNFYLEGTAESNPNSATLERSDGGSSDWASTSALTPHRRYHVVATYDGANMRMYLNGVLQDTVASTRNMPNTAQAMQIGGNPFMGNIDEVAIYTTALGAPRIAAHYAAGRQ